MYKDILSKVTNNEVLTAEDISEFIGAVAKDEVTPVQIAGFQVGRSDAVQRHGCVG